MWLPPAEASLWRGLFLKGLLYVGKNRKTIILFLLSWIVLPILLILVIQEKGTLSLKKEESIEMYLPFMVAHSMKEDMHMETIKAQSVIMRSNLLKMMEDEEVSTDEIKEKYAYFQRDTYLEWKDRYEQAVRACKETEGEILTYQKEVCYCPYFFNSNGVTRDAFEVFSESEYPYLISVPSHRDEECNTYLSYYYYTKKDFGSSEKEENALISILEYDKAGYVSWVKVGDTVMGGEVFREQYGLPSSCFSVEQQENQIRIVCKGNGHGFGFSQYGANTMAKEGKNYEQLLKYYFPEVSLEKSV